MFFCLVKSAHMPVSDRHTQILKALRQIEKLPEPDRLAIIALGLGLYDSLVLGHMKEAGILLREDASHPWQIGAVIWQKWAEATEQALENALRYRKNDALVLAVAVVVALYPILRLGARLAAYRALSNISRSAQRSGFSLKRERRAQPLRTGDIITRREFCLTPDGQIYLPSPVTGGPEAPPSDQCHERLLGIEVDYYNVEPVIRLVDAVIPVYWKAEGSRAFIIPRPLPGR